MSLDKYNLANKVEALSEDIKGDIEAALKAAEKKFTFGTVISHWRELLIIALIVVAVYFLWSKNKAEAELATKNETYNQLKKIADIDATLKSVQQHQQELYPQIDKSISGIEATRNQLKELDKKVTAANRSKYRADAATLSTTQLSQELERLGYPNKVVTGAPQ